MLLGLWGASAYLAVLVPRELASGIAARLSTARRVAIVLAVATTFVALPLEAAMVADGWDHALRVETLRAVLFETSVGRAWQAQAAAAVLLAAMLPIPRACRSGATAAASGLSLITLSLSGHAAMHEGWLGLAHRANDSLHVLAGGAWLGALVPLLPILRSFDDPRSRRAAAVALRRFSSAGHGAVALVILTGILNTILVVGGWPLHWSLPYQALLSLKVAAVAVMTALAMVNRYAVVPGMGPPGAASPRLVRRITLAEVALGSAVVALVSVFGLLEPD